MSPIPERDPITDRFAGYLYSISDSYFLSSEPQRDGLVIAHGELFIRYAVRYLGKPHLSIVPGLLALDYGEILSGEDAWEFLLKKSNLYPRADVVGYRNDGQDDMIAVKLLDLALPVEVLVFSDAASNQPTASVQTLIAPRDKLNSIPPRLIEYLPTYESINEWRAHESS